MTDLDPNDLGNPHYLQSLLDHATHHKSAGVFEAVIVGKQSKSLDVRIVPGLTGRNLHRNRPDGIVVEMDVKQVQRFCRGRLAVEERWKEREGEKK